jgi:dehypoxanthine futalosine cyclase
MPREWNERVAPDEALRWLTQADTAELMARADEIRRRRHGESTYYVHSLNLNPTNICENQCGLCAFWRDRDTEGAYTLTVPQMEERLHRAKSWRLTDVHVVGGLNPALDLDYYMNLFRTIRRTLPEVTLQALTAVEVQWLSERSGRPVAEVLAALKAAGMDAVPGGGAEVFASRVRDRICPKKISAEQWLDVHRTAHSLGIPSNATLLFGHIETPEEIIDHLRRLRDLQDQTGGFLAFCPLPFHTAGTKIGVTQGPGGHAIVRVVALARIFLDNFPHIRVLANFLDRKLLQILLHGGADDVGGTSIDERIARSAGAPDDFIFRSVDEMGTFIRGLGFHPALTSSTYGSRASRPFTPSVRSNDTSWRDALDKAREGVRLTADEAVRLHDAAAFQELGRAAHERRKRIVEPDRSTFIIDRNISFTNVCTVGCRFCAYHKPKGDPGAFAMTIPEIVQRVVEAVSLGATQIMLQGGLNPALDLSWYEQMLRAIKSCVPGIWLHSLSPAEVLWLARRAELPLKDTLLRLREAGLDSLPGGGAEILVDRVRQKVSPAKITTPEWLEVMETAHGMGMSTTATMVYGLGETTAERVQHLLCIRDLQDRTGGFRAFIPWSFQSNHTRLSEPPQTGVDYLRMVALSRLVLDNIDHVQAGWVTEGPFLAQIALTFGADDFGGVLMEESVVKATGISHAVTAEQVIALIRETGMTPAQRDTEYKILRTFDELEVSASEMTRHVAT